jgi:hypothetical protein
MTETKLKAKIKELNLTVKSLAEDSKAKSEMIESQRVTIESLKQLNRNKVEEVKDLYDSLNIMSNDLEDSKKETEQEKEYHTNVSMKTRARLEILKQVLDDAINERVDF